MTPKKENFELEVAESQIISVKEIFVDAKLVEFVTGIDTRIGYPNEHISKTIVEEIKSPMYATGVGLVLKGLNNEDDSVETSQTEEETITTDTKQNGFLSKWLQKGKDWLNDNDMEDYTK